jgi:hypothetical protein
MRPGGLGDGSRRAHQLALTTSSAEMLDFTLASARDGVAAAQATVRAVHPAAATTPGRRPGHRQT